jgi:Leucine-rich repeat (LRR) protein
VEQSTKPVRQSKGKDVKKTKNSRETVSGKEQKGIPRYCFWILACLLLLLGIGAGIAIGLILPRDDGEDAPAMTDAQKDETSAPSPSSPSSSPTALPVATPAPTNDIQRATYDLICQRMPASCDALLTPNTPQNLAMRWLNGNERLALYTDEVKLSRYALAAFYYSTKGDTWSQKQNWLTDADACLWYSTGRSCDANKEIIALALDNNNVSGSIPRDISMLSMLNSISLRNNGEAAMTGTLPYELSLLTGLTTVAISNNQMSGGIPTTFGVWTNLEYLELRNNGLAGMLDGTTFASTYPRLTFIDLGGNRFTGPLPASLFGASLTTALTSLRLDSNQFTGDVPSDISKLMNLQDLSLAGNNLNNFPYSVTLLPSLQAFDVSDNGFGGYLISQIGNMANLRQLLLRGNALTGPLPTDLGRLTNLQTVLDLSGNSFSSTIPTQLGLLTGLQRLYLNNNTLTGGVPVELANLSTIQAIRLDNNNLIGQIPSEICTLYSQLTPLSYADCDEIQADCFTYCCVDGADCTCRYASTMDATRCFAPPS